MPLKNIENRFGKIGRTWPLLSASLISVVSIWLIFVGIAYQTYRTAWHDSELFAADVTLLLEQSVARDIELYDLTLKALDENASNPEIMRLPMAIRRIALFDRSANAPGMGAVLLVDKDGDVVSESTRVAPPKVNLADRAYFLAQRDRSAPSQPFVSHPLYSRITQTSSIVLSRPRFSPGGVFNGIVCGALRIDYLNGMFASVPLPPGSTITLMHRDGTLLARSPSLGMDLSRGLRAPVLYDMIQSGKAGPTVLRSGIDGVERLVAYHQVGTLPVYLSVGLSTQEFLGIWRWRLEIVGLAFLGLTSIILFLGILLARELNRRRVAERTLSELAATDSLTRLANRRRFDEMLQIEWRRALREAMPVSLLMIDGDFFKAFNDTYGHVEGDHALRRVADTLKRAAERPADLVARFGGEEFVVLLPGTDREGANKIAEAIKSSILELALPHVGSPLGILTVSIGVASRWPRATEPVSSLIEAADAALYIAKAEGRDRIVIDDGAKATRAA